MSYTFQPDSFYRMPTHFGPSLGPRQGPKGRRYACVDFPHGQGVYATFKVNGEQLKGLLPPGFSLREPHVINFAFEYITQIEWLAGRGYNTFGVSLPVTYTGKSDVVNGNLLLVLWENMADPIITGREDLGFSKVYCELPELQTIGNDIICRASWDGFEFASLKLSNVKAVNVDQLPPAIPSGGSLHYKYIPKTGAPGQSDVEYATFTPAAEPNSCIDDAQLAETASMQFNTATWEQLPTLVHIVNTFAALELGDCVKATVLKVRGAKDLSDQRILR